MGAYPQQNRFVGAIIKAMENNNYPGQIPGQGQQIGTGEGESPIIKSTIPNMDVRTMASDMQSVNSGSPAPKPYAPQTTAPANIPMAPMSVTPPPDQSFQIPQTDIGGNQSNGPTPKKSSKGIFTALIVFIVIIGLAALGYFVIYPIFFATPAVPAPVVENPIPTPTPEPIPTPTPEPTSTTPVIPPAPVHVSLFTTPANSQIEAATVTTGTALSSLSLNTTASPSLTEIIYKDSTGNLIKFADLLKGVLGLDISSNSALASVFDDQTATGLVYVDTNSTRWLGFAVQLTTGASASAAFQQAFETITSYSNLFTSDPGTAQTWKDGQITGVTGNRYLLFSKSGFTVDYGWVGNKLVILTSYNGFKDAVNRLK